MSRSLIPSTNCPLDDLDFEEAAAFGALEEVFGELVHDLGPAKVKKITARMIERTAKEADLAAWEAIEKATQE